ncbi:transglutaminase-like cysteine peptidase [Rhodoferax aquaticus]|uniref:Sulfate adenylyltransferase n=1 Tax=Rhodoferax aquaticus TaxID=2527691 RepID=A0A515EPF4_9BURK|nr:transglutaminase-like cysteine peptidase [Rhodoferax aquaticus]QDL54547.1 sulfate adenylyltransferase [Rhodoferax aquaticus]
MALGLSWLKKPHVPVACLLLSVALVAPGWAGLLDFSDNLVSYVEKRWGREAPPRLKVWQRVVRDSKAATDKGQTEPATMKVVNSFFNQVPYISDLEHWKVLDYWATPVELLGSFGGDCEDYSISKYLSLKDIGVPVEKLRITYVRALRLGEAHMVLAYYPTPDADPLILDNLIGDIRPASQRTDLEPVYGFNDDDLWVTGGAARKGGASNVRLWRDLLEKLAKEQRM